MQSRSSFCSFYINATSCTQQGEGRNSDTLPNTWKEGKVWNVEKNPQSYSPCCTQEHSRLLPKPTESVSSLQLLPDGKNSKLTQSHQVSLHDFQTQGTKCTKTLNPHAPPEWQCTKNDVFNDTVIPEDPREHRGRFSRIVPPATSLLLCQLHQLV